MLSSHALFANAVGDNEACRTCMLSSYALFANPIGDNEAIAGGSETSGEVSWEVFWEPESHRCIGNSAGRRRAEAA